MTHSPVPRIWTLHCFSHSTNTTRSRASHSQIIRPDSVSHSTRIFRTLLFSSALNRFNSRATSWRVMQAITWAETNLGIFFNGGQPSTFSRQRVRSDISRAPVADNRKSKTDSHSFSRVQSEHRRYYPILSNCHRNCAPSHNRVDTSTQTTYAMNALQYGNRR